MFSPENGMWIPSGNTDGTQKEKLEFLTRWKGEDPSDDTWEPVEAFVEQYCYELVKYCRTHKLRVDLME